jgi:ribonuclease HI
MDQIPTIADLLGPYHDYDKAAHLLRKINCINASQILDPNDPNDILGYNVIKKRAGLNPRGRYPSWYRNLKMKINRHPNSPFDMPSTSNGHSRKWKKTTEQIFELVNIDLNDTYFQTTNNQFLEIDSDYTNRWREAKADINTCDALELTFYTDGSLKLLAENQTTSTQTVMGAAWINQETQQSFRHKIEGIASSTNPETKAVFSVLEICPQNRRINICTDSQAVLHGLNDIIKENYENRPISHILKKPEWPTWEAIASLIKEKT